MGKRKLEREGVDTYDWPYDDSRLMTNELNELLELIDTMLAADRVPARPDRSNVRLFAIFYACLPSLPIQTFEVQDSLRPWVRRNERRGIKPSPDKSDVPSGIGVMN
jgi:hypothetical protein